MKGEKREEEHRIQILPLLLFLSLSSSSLMALRTVFVA